MFTSTDTALVITQGHPSRVSLMLRVVGGASPAPPPRATAVIPPLPPLPPAPEIRNLPATFSGTLPCADCPGIRYQLSLFPDDTFMLRMTYTAKDPSTTRDEVGSWALSSDRRALAIKSADGPPEYFAIRDAGTLRKLDMDGQPMASGRPYDLHRMPAPVAIEFKGSVRGAYRAGLSGATFTPCATGRPWPVGHSATDAAVEAAYRTAGRRPDEPLLLDVQGHLRPGTGADSTFLIDVVGAVAANGACDVRFGAAPLEGTSWKLVWLSGAAFAAPASPRNQPTLTFRGDTPTFAGNGGCNRLAGRYDVRGDTLTMSAAGTMMACPGADATEAAFKAAITGTRAYRILGEMLELYGDRRQLLARFEAQKPQG
jgi:copper homeostasis protein (lipoprotein)